jgi:hypothetical protein
VSRRSMMLQAVKRNQKKQGAPLIIILPAWCARDGEPLVTWATDHRTPTKEEIAAAVAEWKREQAAKKSDDVIHEKSSTMKPAQGSGEDEEIN